MEVIKFEYNGVTLPIYLVENEAEIMDCEALDTLDDYDALQAVDTNVLVDATLDGLMMDFEAVDAQTLDEWTNNLYGMVLSFYRVNEGTHYAIIANR